MCAILEKAMFRLVESAEFNEGPLDVLNQVMRNDYDRCAANENYNWSNSL